MDLSNKGAIKKRRIREFKNAWLDENIFKGWLAPHPAENKALCIACNKTIRCCKTDLIKHSQTVNHIEKVNSCNYEATSSKENLTHKEQVKRAEIKLATFFAEHNVAFQIADHLVPLLKDICISPICIVDICARFFASST